MTIENIYTPILESSRNPIEVTTSQNLVINIIRDVNLAVKAKGLAIIIDVFRAFSTECFVFQNGVNLPFPTTINSLLV